MYFQIWLCVDALVRSLFYDFQNLKKQPNYQNGIQFVQQHCTVVSAVWRLTSKDNIYRTLRAGKRNHCKQHKLLLIVCSFKGWAVVQLMTNQSILSPAATGGAEKKSHQKPRTTCSLRYNWRTHTYTSHTFTSKFCVIYQDCMCKHDRTHAHTQRMSVCYLSAATELRR